MLSKFRDRDVTKNLTTDITIALQRFLWISQKENLTARKNTCNLDPKFVIKHILYFVSKLMVSFT